MFSTWNAVGYHAALRGLSATQAASIQLTVPVVAAVGGLVFTNELVTLRLVMSAILILGGVGLTPGRREKLTSPTKAKRIKLKRNVVDG
jgi:drug/metabolite transporter (DMT)-like permease